jgi:two-component system sensor histidine kinase/response regulator
LSCRGWSASLAHLISEGDIDEGAFPAAAILAADDRAPNLLALSAILEPLHVDLVTATSGREAIEKASHSAFAAILLDVMMPDMDGFETLASLRSLPLARHTPVILLTAHELDTRDMEKVKGMGSVDYILKPIAAELLRSKVAALVSLHRRGEALTAKDRQIAMLAHDLQSPLTAISVAADSMCRTELDPRSQNLARVVQRGTARMSKMVQDLTDYARAGRGAIPIVREQMDLGDLALEIVEEFLHTYSGRRIDLARGGDLRGNWDRTRLYQALSNLMMNAIRYGTGAIAVRAQDGTAYIEVSVHNDGPPIPEEFLPMVFRPFERGVQTRAGLGLGLYIVREIAKAHSGDVVATSSSELGTTFTIRLPRTA